MSQASYILLESALLKSLWIKMVNFKLGNKMWRVNLPVHVSTWHNKWQRKNLSAGQESNPWPPEHWMDALSTDLQNSWRPRSFNWVHRWLESCILLESVLPRSYLSHARIMLISSPFTLFLFHSLTLARLLVLYKQQKITKNKMRPALSLQWISSMLIGDHKELWETLYMYMYSMNSLVTKHYQENTSELHVNLVYA